MYKLQMYDLVTGEIILEESYASNRNAELFARFNYLCFVSTIDQRVEIYSNDTRICSYNYGGAL